jgi:hypothetical protein
MEPDTAGLRLILCRPQGGLTDMLSRIGACLSYADRFDRTVIVETDFADAHFFRDRFDRYFISHDDKLILNPAPYVGMFDALPCEPSELAGRVTSYSTEYSQPLNALTEVGTGLITQFNFRKNHQVPLLLHHAVGGSIRKAAVALRRLSITPEVLDVYEKRKEKIGDSYSAVHIRHTDYNTNYREHVLKLKDEIEGKVYVATDNRDVLAYCKEVLGSERVYNFSTFPVEAGQALHGNSSLDPWQCNLDALVDLLLLASARNFYFFQLTEQRGAKPAYSGFSLLVQLLHTNKRLLRSLTYSDSRDTWSDLRMKCRKSTYRLSGVWTWF